MVVVVVNEISRYPVSVLNGVKSAGGANSETAMRRFQHGRSWPSK